MFVIISDADVEELLYALDLVSMYTTQQKAQLNDDSLRLMVQKCIHPVITCNGKNNHNILVRVLRVLNSIIRIIE